jgi:gliding motility-associated-like protein
MKNRLMICLLLLLLSFKGYSQCTLNVITAQSSTALCSGNKVTLAATASGGTAPYTYIWSTGETTPSISIDKAGTYTVTVSDKTPGCQPVKKSLTVTSAAVPNAPTARSVVVCPNSSAQLAATAPGGTYQWYASATGNDFLASGDTYNTPAITANTVFYVETTLGGCTSPRTAVTVSLSAKPVVTGAAICAGNVATLSVAAGDSFTWYDAPSGGNVVGTDQSFTTPVLTATKTYYVVVVNNGCTSAPTPVTATVTAFPKAPTAPGVTVCAGSTANLHASGASGVYNWFYVPSGGIPLISSPDYTTPPLSATTTYYVESSVNSCESSRTAVTVTVNPIPAAPATQTVNVCYGTSTAITAGPVLPSGSYQWYTALSGGTPFFTGNTYTTPALTSSATYYVLANNGGCSSSRTQINFTVSPQVPAPSVTGAIVCSGTPATLTASGPSGSTYNWYNVATDGTPIATNTSSYTTSALTATTKYYVQMTLASGCVSPRAAVTATVLPPPAALTASGATICAGSTAVLTASVSAGGYAWYAAIPISGPPLSTARVFTTPALTTTTTYYLAATNSNNCLSTLTPVTVTVNPEPSPPTPAVTNPVSTCSGTSATLTATGAGVIKWYTTLTGGTPIATGTNTATYTTPSLSATTTYYVDNTTGSCTSTPRTPVTVTVTPLADAQFHYSSGTYCVGSSDQTPVVNTPGGTFSATPAGLSINASTGVVTMASSTAGTYTITYTSNSSCPTSSSVKFSIVTSTSSTFSYSAPSFCQDGVNPSPTFAGTSSAGTFSATPTGGLVFVNTSTGEINLAASAPGNYTVTNTITNTGGTCPTVSSTAMVTINQRVIVSAGPNQTVAAGSTVTLAGSISGGITTGTWSAGTGSFTNATSPSGATYIPAPGATSATLTLTSDDPPGVCGLKSATVTITFATTPAAPTAPGVTICAGNPAFLTATAPGGNYQWFDASENPLVSGVATYTTPPLTATTKYFVQTTVNGLTSPQTTVVVTVNPVPAPPIASSLQICAGSPATLSASGEPVGSTYDWYGSATGNDHLFTGANQTITGLTTSTSYYVQATNGGCASTRTEVDVTVNPVPNVTSIGTGNICSGNALNYTITADNPAATFSWSRAQVTGISNPAVTNQTPSTIGETLINTTGAAVKVTYVITPTIGSCPGPAFNYVVTVFPTPMVTSPATATICNMTTDNYAITFNTAGTSFSWSRAVVPGISNAAVTGQAANVIREVLFNTTTAPVDVTYVINYSTGICPGTPFTLVVTVNPSSTITSATSGTVCSGVPEDYVITSNIPSATFLWSRNAVANISNPAVTNQTSGTIDETLINTGTTAVGVVYSITPLVNGCPGTTFKYTVVVNPQIATPVANSNSPVCIGTTIHLLTPTVPGASYLWTGPNGYSSTKQNSDIDNVTDANAGIYNLIVMVKDCSSPTASTNVAINELPVANAGPDQLVCIFNPLIILAGNVSGGTTTGIWTTAGSGTFLPASNVLNAQYIPSDADKAAGSVILTLSSTSTDNCNISTSSMTVTFGPLPVVNAGGNQAVCSQSNSIPLNGKIAIPGGGSWSTSGTGTFSPSATQLNAAYVPSAADEQSGLVTLTLRATGANECDIPTDSLTIRFVPPPTVNAGGTRYVLKGNTITLDPVVSNDSVHYSWFPNVDINNDTLKNPVITGDMDITYTLTITDSRGCVAQDQTFIKVSPEIKVNNTFTPNGDGINDYWDITGLIAYNEATVDIFNRYGQKVFHSLGYPKPWDGTYNGQRLPVGVYYYVINTNYQGQVLSGYVTIIR